VPKNEITPCHQQVFSVEVCIGVYVVSGVQVAARSLIQLFREKNPRLLHHKYRVTVTARHCVVGCVVQW